MGPTYVAMNNQGSSAAGDSALGRWLRTVRLSRVVLCIAAVLTVVPVVTHWYLSGGGLEPRQPLDAGRSLVGGGAAAGLGTGAGGLRNGHELGTRVEEMLRIKVEKLNVHLVLFGKISSLVFLGDGNLHHYRPMRYWIPLLPFLVKTCDGFQ